jgi:hypothetical protein
MEVVRDVMNQNVKKVLLVKLINVSVMAVVGDVANQNVKQVL